MIDFSEIKRIASKNKELTEDFVSKLKFYKKTTLSTDRYYISAFPSELLDSSPSPIDPMLDFYSALADLAPYYHFSVKLSKGDFPEKEAQSSDKPKEDDVSILEFIVTIQPDTDIDSLIKALV